MWTVYALAFDAKGADALVKVGCTQGTNVDSRLANYHGFSVPGGSFLPDDCKTNLLAVITDPHTVLDRFDNPASAVEQDVLSIVGDLDLLCSDEWEAREGRNEVFYATIDSWRSIREALHRPDASAETREFLRTVFVALYGEEELDADLASDDHEEAEGYDPVRTEEDDREDWS